MRLTSPSLPGAGSETLTLNLQGSPCVTVQEKRASPMGPAHPLASQENRQLPLWKTLWAAMHSLVPFLLGTC